MSNEPLINGCTFCQYAHDALTSPKEIIMAAFAEGLLIGQALANGVPVSKDCCPECSPLLHAAIANRSDRPIVVNAMTGKLTDHEDDDEPS